MTRAARPRAPRASRRTAAGKLRRRGWGRRFVLLGPAGARDAAGGLPGREGLGVVLVAVGKQGVEGLHRPAAPAQVQGDRRRGAHLARECVALLAFALLEGVGHGEEIVGRLLVAQRVELVGQREVRDGLCKRPQLGGHGGVAFAGRHAETIHDRGVASFLRDGRGRAVETAERGLHVGAQHALVLGFLAVIPARLDGGLAAEILDGAAELGDGGGEFGGHGRFGGGKVRRAAVGEFAGAHQHLGDSILSFGHGMVLRFEV